MTYEYPEYEVEVRFTVAAIVKVRAKNPLSAAKVADDVNTPLPPCTTWDAGITDFEYIVREPGNARELYHGDAQELT